MPFPQRRKKKILLVATTDEMSIKDRKKELLSNLTHKKAYNILISKEIKPPTSQIKILNMGISETDLPHLYLIPFTVTSETKISMFQYKILHNILPTNSLLYKMEKVDTPKCPHSEHQSQDIKHMFLNCQGVKDFWRCFHNWYNNGGSRLNLKQAEILYGVISKTKSGSTLNHILIVAKFHIYSCNYDKTHPNLQRFITLLKDEISTEKYIAYASHAEESFKKKWEPVITLLTKYVFPFETADCNFFCYLYLILQNVNVYLSNKRYPGEKKKSTSCSLTEE